MENFAEYILNEEDLMQKMEITYYLSRKKRILFRKYEFMKHEFILNLKNGIRETIFGSCFRFCDNYLIIMIFFIYDISFLR